MPEQGLSLIYESGPWQVHLGRRELLAHGVAVPIGSRAFEIVEVLVRSANELVTKDDLIGRIWPGASVGDNTLQVHISAIRKALGRDRVMLKTASGRGYRLIGRWTARPRDSRTEPAGLEHARVAPDPTEGNLPVATADLIGRADAVRHLRDLISAYRTVTLTGPGGIGKSRLALEVANKALPDFDGSVWLVELAALSDASLVATAVAGVLGLHLPGTGISAEALARAIGSRKLLFVIDNCEHLIDAAATMVETIVRLCTGVSVLATSREPMRIEGERIYRVAPLDYPEQDKSGADREGILATSAVRLFIARMTALQAGSRYLEEYSTIAAVCRHLDGIPLAIEFAAARAATLGLDEVLSRLDDRFALLTSGRRTALPKHRTLRATFDWSYELLSGFERLLLRRLAVFAAAFSLEAASSVVASGEAPSTAIADGVASLVAKSLVTADNTVTAVNFRLLETTRAYALEKLTESGESREYFRKHATYYRGLLEAIIGEWGTRPVHPADVGNARAALEWCFGSDGDYSIGIGLAASAAPIFSALALLTECHRWSERAIVALDETTRGGREEMRLQAVLGMSLMFMRGETEAAHVALNKGLAIAQAHGDALNQVGMLGVLSMFHTRDGDYKTALLDAKRSRIVAGTVTDPAALALAQSILGRALHFMGDHTGAREELEASFRYWSGSRRTSEIDLGLDHRMMTGLGLARTMWLLGHPVQATECLRQTIKNAETRNHPASLGLALSWAPGIFLWTGELGAAEEYADWLISHATSHSLRPYLIVGHGYKGELAIRHGDAKSGVQALRDCLQQFHLLRYKMRDTEFRLSLVQGLVAIGRFGEAMTLVDETISLVEASEELLYMPELLRVKACVLLSLPEPIDREAETCLGRSLEFSRRQGARAWELRTAIDLAALLIGRAEPENARTLLRPVYDHFVGGLDTADLKAAERLLAALG